MFQSGNVELYTTSWAAGWNIQGLSLGNSKERFQLLKEFLIDENLLDTEVIYMDVWFHTDTNGGKVIYGWFILIIFSESKVWGRGGGLLCQVKPLFLILQCRYLGPAK